MENNLGIKHPGDIGWVLDGATLRQEEDENEYPIFFIELIE